MKMIEIIDVRDILRKGRKRRVKQGDRVGLEMP